MSTELRRIGEKARSDPQLVFTSLYHHICDQDNLRACFDALPKDRAVGIDGVSKDSMERIWKTTSRTYRNGCAARAIAHNQNGAVIFRSQEAIRAER